MKLQIISAEKLTSLEALEDFEITPKALTLLVMVDLGHMNMLARPDLYFPQLRDHYVRLIYKFKKVYLFPGQPDVESLMVRAATNVAREISQFIETNYPDDGELNFVHTRAVEIKDDSTNQTINVLSSNFLSPIPVRVLPANPPPANESFFRRLRRRFTDLSDDNFMPVLRGELDWLENAIRDSDDNPVARFVVVLCFPTSPERYVPLRHLLGVTTVGEFWDHPCWDGRKAMFFEFGYQGEGCTSNAYCNGCEGEVEFGTNFAARQPDPVSIGHCCDGYVVDI